MLIFGFILLSLGMLFLVLSGLYIGNAEKRKAVMLGVHLTLIVPGSFQVAGFLANYHQSFTAFLACLALTVLLVLVAWYTARFFVGVLRHRLQ